VERKLKGINFNGMVASVRRAHGEPTLRRALGRVEGEVGAALRDGTIIATGWYPASWYGALLRAVSDELGGGEARIRELAREAVSADFRTLFRVIRLFLKPEKAVEQSTRVAKRYIDGGDIEVAAAGDGFIHYRIRDFDGYTRLMWWDFVGGVEGVLTNLGATDFDAQIVAGGGDGDAHLEVVLRWRS